MANKNGKGTVVKPGILDNQTDFSELINARDIKATGNLVLVFQNSEVIMPGAWRLHRDLCIGDRIKAYWDDSRKFHLEFEDEQ